MNKKQFLLLSAFCFAASGNNSVSAETVAEQTQQIKDVLSKIKAINVGAPVQEHLVKLNANQILTQEELLSICEASTKSLLAYDDILETEHFEQLQLAVKTLTSQLKDYKISGFGLANHLSFNFLYGRQNFNVPLVFKNQSGEPFARNFNIKYAATGWQAECVWRIDAVFAVNSDLSRLATRSTLEFSTGFTGGWRLPVGPSWVKEWGQDQERVSAMFGPAFREQLKAQFPMHKRMPLAVLGVTVLPLKNQQGSMLIAHLGVGLTGFSETNSTFAANSFNAAIVHSGGTLTPAADVTSVK